VQGRPTGCPCLFNMPRLDQGVTRDRYQLIPRTAVFVRRGDEYLLIKGAATKRLWAGKYNCPGGHVERGEDVLSAARRELAEETGLQADLVLCGTVIVDVGETGICLFVFLGEHPMGELQPSAEGSAEWVRLNRIAELPVVEDLPALLGRLAKMEAGGNPFSARSFYDSGDHLVLQFID
jgi:8-oxo-dGTP diphosphatase